MGYISIYVILSIVFSLLGLLPWNIETRWSLNDMSIVAVSMMLMFLVIESSFPTIQQVAEQLSAPWLKSSVFVIFLSIVLFLTINRVDVNWIRSDGRNIVKPLLNEECVDSVTYLDASIYPDARYFVQFDLNHDKSAPLQSRRFELFPGLTNLEKWKNSDQKTSACLIMSTNWDPLADAKNRATLLGIGFYEVREYSREFGGLGWILFKRTSEPTEES
jgi:hypothetical protein